jgi:putative tricarboxylic transport membrane protein
MKVSVRNIRIISLSILAVSVFVLAPALSGAASFVPTRPIEIVCFASPGGGSGIFAETVGGIMEKEKIVPVPMPRIYKSGGGFAVGMAYLAEKKGNPHFLGSTANPFILTPLVVTASGKKTITHKDFTQIAILAFDEMAVVVKYDAPYKNLKELIAAAKSKPKSIKFGGTNVGGTDSLLIASLAKAAGVEFNYIAFQGGGEVNAALLGGHIDAMSANPTEMLPQIEGKTMRMLAVASEKRLSGSDFKDLPTMKELSYNVVFNTHRGITAPPGISAEAVAYYENAFKKLSENDTFKKYIAENNMTPTYMNSVQAVKYMNDFADYATVLLKDLGIAKK